MSEISYFEKRLQKLGITEDMNKVELLFGVNEKGQSEMDEATGKWKIFKRPVPIFRRHEKGIEIIVYTLQRSTIMIEKEGSRYKKEWSIIRLEKPVIKNDGDQMKYQMPKGHGSFPFFPPALLDKFDNKTPIDTLYITEGFFKAFKGSMHGIDIVGIASITHMKSKEKGSLHDDILLLIRTCKVRRVVWLTDGDCLDISSKANEKDKIDLYKRPAAFFSSINTFKQMLDDYEVDKYFAHVDTDAIVAEYKKDRADVKGLDDVLIAFPDRISEIIGDLSSVSKRGFWFNKFNITVGLSKVREYFRLNNINNFYLFHAERGELAKGKEFIFYGTRYKYNEDKGECDVVIPGEASNYFRVGDDYYKFIMKPNKYGHVERHFDGRLKTTIVDDHGKKFISYIPKYEAFCNTPSHTNFQQIIENCFNVYSPLDHTPLEEECTAEDCPTILKFLQHIFGHALVNFQHPKTKEKKEISTYDLGLDYIQLLYQRPWEKLPILCLVSHENNTGKSTFGKLLKQIFGGNCAIVGNQDLAGDFNKHWATKTIVICDETKIDKQTVIEKVKSLSTADKIMMNAKGRDHIEIDCFIKFIFITNNEDNFIYVTEDDIRYWVIKVPVIAEENPTLLDTMIEEIPAFLSYMNRRKLATEKLNRMWFHPKLLKTEALKKVMLYSRSTVEKEIIAEITEMFLDFGLDEIYLSRKNIQEEFFNKRYEAAYIEKILKEHLKVDQYWEADKEKKDMFGNPEKKYKVIRYTYPKWDSIIKDGKKEKVRVEVSNIGRPYVFKRADFVKDINVEIMPEDVFLNSMSAPVTSTGMNGNSKNGNDTNLPF